jgi:hypothetical protein
MRNCPTPGSAIDNKLEDLRMILHNLRESQVCVSRVFVNILVIEFDEGMADLVTENVRNC